MICANSINVKNKNIWHLGWTGVNSSDHKRSFVISGHVIALHMLSLPSDPDVVDIFGLRVQLPVTLFLGCPTRHGRALCILKLWL